MVTIKRTMPKFDANNREQPQATFTITREPNDLAANTIARKLRYVFGGARVATRGDILIMSSTDQVAFLWNMLTPDDVYTAITGKPRRTAHVATGLYGHRHLTLDASWELTDDDIAELEVLGMTVAPMRSAPGIYVYDLLVPIANNLIDRKFITQVLQARPTQID